MAWVTEYDLGWHSTDHNGTISIQRDGGSYIMPLELKANSLEISNVIPGWESPIARMNCTFTIVNNLSDFYDLMPLMTIANGQYKVVVTNDSYQSDPFIMFEGFINCEAVNQNMLNFADLRVTASGMLNKLQYTHPASIDTLQYMSLIDIIDDCLTISGEAYPIYVNCALYELNATLGSGQTLFNRTAVYTELFWNNNIERMSALEILESILRSFNCYLYWVAQRWYINYYANLDMSKTHVIYTSGVSYGYADTGGLMSPYAPTASLIHNSVWHKQVGGTQQLQVIPGLQRLDIELNQKDFYNLFNPDLSESTDTFTSEGAIAKRAWTSYDSGGIPNVTWADRGGHFKNIDNSIKRFASDTVNGSLQLNGLTTRFNTSTNGFDTILTISFKFGVLSKGGLGPWMDESEFDNEPQNTTITFYWYLSTYEGGQISLRDFVWYNAATEKYELLVDQDEQDAYNTLVITAADMDKDLLTYSGTIIIPIGEVISTSSGDSDNLDLVFRMGTELVSKAGETDNVPNVCYYGDFRAVTSGSPEDNLLRGDITTDFLNKMTVSMDLFDAGWNYRNSLVRNTGAIFLTEEWLGNMSLAEVLLSQKFRLYRIARQMITMDVHDIIVLPSYGILVPWTDSKQSNMVFIQLENVHKPQSNTRTVTLYEYDDTEDITLS